MSHDSSGDPVPSKSPSFGELLMGVFDVPPEAREEFLRDACGDPELRSRVLAALAAEDELDHFLEAPAIDRLGPVTPKVEGGESVDSDPSGSDPSGSDLSILEAQDRVGPFRIVSLLGRGGMGEVFLAEQTDPVERRVALKILPRSFGLRELEVRFEAERRALARLSHRHIARLYEADSTTDGRPYFAMEWVDGLPISAYCNAHQLSLEERLRLFLGVCSGVQHAHEKGLIHRDLKPANILVTEDGEAKVIDFGIAKAVDRPLVEGTLMTGEHILGTPGYLPPEAFQEGRGSLDTRSDVYSLGVVLYVLLVGCGPFEVKGLSLPELAERMTRADAPSLTARLAGLSEMEKAASARDRGLETAELFKQLNGDLSWIVGRAVATEPEQRYASPAELAADIQRYLDLEPVLAGPPSTLYRMRKLAQRNRGLVVAASLVFSALVVGISGLAVGLVESRKAQREAAEQADLARREAENARQALAETQEMTDFLRRLFADANPRTHQGNVPSAEDLLLEGAERIRTSFPDRPQTRARFLHTIGEIFGELGLYPKAAPLLEEALTLLEDDLGQGHPELTRVLDSLGLAYLRLGRFDEGRALLERAVLIGDSSPGGSAVSLASSLQGLGMMLQRQGLYDESRARFQRALELRQLELGKDSAPVAITLSSLASLDVAQGQVERGVERYQRALKIRELVLPKGHPDVADSLAGLGLAYQRLGRQNEAEDVLIRSLEIRERAYGAEHPRVVRSVDNLAIVYAQGGRLDEAEPLFHRSFELKEKIYGAEHPQTALSLNNLGNLLLQREKIDQAEPLLRRAFAIRMKVLGREHRHTASTLHNLGIVALKQGRLREAEANIAEALANFESVTSPEALLTVPPRVSLASLRREQGRLKEAEEQLRLSMEILDDNEAHPYWSGVAEELILVLRDLGRDHEADELAARLDRPA